MLVLTRHVHQSIVIGHDVVVTVLEVRGDQVRLGITAPKDVQVHREEVFAALTAANREAATSATSAAELEVLKHLSNEHHRATGGEHRPGVGEHRPGVADRPSGDHRQGGDHASSAPVHSEDGSAPLPAEEGPIPAAQPGSVPAGAGAPAPRPIPPPPGRSPAKPPARP